MRINRSLLNWGVFLIALGGVPLAVEQGWLESDVVGDLLKLWPLILVGIGLGLMLRWTVVAWLGGAIVAATFGIIFGSIAAAAPDEDLSAWQQVFPAVAINACGAGGDGVETAEDSDLASSTAFAVEVRLSCADLSIARGEGTTWSATAAHPSDAQPVIEGTPAQLRLGQEGSDEIFVLGQGARSDWQVELPAEASVSLDTTLDAVHGSVDLGGAPVAAMSATLNASDLEFDLGDVGPTEAMALDLVLNASSARVSLPAGPIVGHADLSAASLAVCVPASAEVRVELDGTLGSDDLGGSGLVQRNGGWQTEGYDTAATRIDLDIQSTVSSVSLERAEGCA